MTEGKRQKQVAAVLEQELNDIFRRLNLTMLDGGMVSIASVKITPDLFDARVYLSLFKVANPQETLKKVKDKQWEIKKELAERIRHQLRSIPQLSYYIDDTLAYVDKMETLFKEIRKQDDEAKPKD